MMSKMGKYSRLGLLGLAAILLAPPIGRLAQAQTEDPADSGLRLEWRIETEPEYHHKYTNCVLVQGTRKLVFQPPAGWNVRLMAADRKVVCQPVTSGEWLSLQLVSTNALVSKTEAVAIAPATTNIVIATPVPAPSNVSLIKLETLQKWFKTGLPSAEITQSHEVHANGLPGVAAALQYTDGGRLRFCQTACVDLSTNFVVLIHALPDTNQNSLQLNGVLSSLSLETNAPPR